MPTATWFQVCWGSTGLRGCFRCVVFLRVVLPVEERLRVPLEEVPVLRLVPVDADFFFVVDFLVDEVDFFVAANVVSHLLSLLSYHKTGKNATETVAFFRRGLYSIRDRAFAGKIHGFPPASQKIFFLLSGIVHTFVIAACYTYLSGKELCPLNIAIILSYDGTAYHGWQTQRNASSVQQTVTEGISELLGQPVTVSGVGRTDAGVHARRYVANFHGDCTIPMDRLPLAINAHLPMDIAVSGAAVVPDSFDARFSCTRKEYTYLICPGRIRDPFAISRSYFYPYPLDVAAMQQAAQYFIGRQDFAAVRSMGTPVKSTVREIFTCSVDTLGSYVRIRVSADGFLYNMVRAISGTLLYAGQGKFPPEHIRRILDSCDREQAGPTLPPQGLYMSRLWYEDTPELDPFRLSEEWNGSGGLLS